MNAAKARKSLMQRCVPLLLGLVAATAGAASSGDDPTSASPVAMPEPPPSYQVQPIGWVRKRDGRTTIELYDAYRPVLLGASPPARRCART
jgi:hypothetical protein